MMVHIVQLEAEDAVAEGMMTTNVPTSEFRHLWELINGKRGFGWDVNPWVWVVEFGVVA